MKTLHQRNSSWESGVVTYTDPINETHVSRPGLVVVDVAAADDDTALAFQQLLAEHWATSTAERTTRDVGQPGVRLRCYLDLRQPIGMATAPTAAPPLDASEPGRIDGSLRTP
ncbi:DUF6207 family protein [Streptomyces sp. NBC_00576]|uniref:DUF6207 family protein n=1 Tax=Streptomyces sp. NBC_00576 TaxID=2903665 RepID=UPI002E80BCC3|nr:DUF6207 family protein [Streptomyces sp. NBC_00576]WUB76970.1 DUF6207 family protein [Streptomyces sp. NBC_00576]